MIPGGFVLLAGTTPVACGSLAEVCDEALDRDMAETVTVFARNTADRVQHLRLRPGIMIRLAGRKADAVLV